MKKLLVIGSGRMGQIRMRASRIIPNLQLCGIVDENIKNAQKYGDQYGIPVAQNIDSFIKVSSLRNTDYELYKYLLYRMKDVRMEYG